MNLKKCLELYRHRAEENELVFVLAPFIRLMMSVMNIASVRLPEREFVELEDDDNRAISTSIPDVPTFVSFANASVIYLQIPWRVLGNWP